jgi:hypothetical protein
MLVKITPCVVRSEHHARFGAVLLTSLTMPNQPLQVMKSGDQCAGLRLKFSLYCEQHHSMVTPVADKKSVARTTQEERPVCAGITKKKKPCSNRAPAVHPADSLWYCQDHRNQASAPTSAATPMTQHQSTTHPTDMHVPEEKADEDTFPAIPLPAAATPSAIVDTAAHVSTAPLLVSHEAQTAQEESSSEVIQTGKRAWRVLSSLRSSSSRLSI